MVPHRTSFCVLLLLLEALKVAVLFQNELNKIHHAQEQRRGSGSTRRRRASGGGGRRRRGGSIVIKDHGLNHFLNVVGRKAITCQRGLQALELLGWKGNVVLVVVVFVVVEKVWFVVGLEPRRDVPGSTRRRCRVGSFLIIRSQQQERRRLRLLVVVAAPADLRIVLPATLDACTLSAARRWWRSVPFGGGTPPLFRRTRFLRRRRRGGKQLFGRSAVVALS